MGSKGEKEIQTRNVENTFCGILCTKGKVEAQILSFLSREACWALESFRPRQNTKPHSVCEDVCRTRSTNFRVNYQTSVDILTPRKSLTK